MKERFWPWKRFVELESQLAKANARAEDALEKLHGLRETHQHIVSEHSKAKDGMRKMADIFVRRGLDKVVSVLVLSLLSLSAFGQPFIRNPVTTNTLANAPTTAYFLGWDGLLSKPAWVVPSAGLSVAVNTNAVAVTNGSLVTISGVTDTNAVQGLIGPATNTIAGYVRTVTAGTTNYVIDATNTSAAYARSLSAADTNNDTVVSNGVVAGVLSGTIALTNAIATLSPTSNQTNYTVPLVCNPNVAVIHMANTNAWLTFTGTNINGYQCTVCFRAFTNSLVSRFTLNLPSWSTNLNLIYFVTNGTCKFVNFYNLDTTGTNVVASDSGTSPHT